MALSRGRKAPGIKVFLVLFFQKKNTSSFSEEKEAKRLLCPAVATWVIRRQPE
jgi:hypothetical protein